MGDRAGFRHASPAAKKSPTATTNSDRQQPEARRVRLLIHSCVARVSEEQASPYGHESVPGTKPYDGVMVPSRSDASSHILSFARAVLS